MGGVTLGAAFCWENLGPATDMDDSLTCTSDLSLVADGCGLFQQDNVSFHKAQMVLECFEEHKNKFQLLVRPPNSPRSQSKQASVGFAGQTDLILGGFSS